MTNEKLMGWNRLGISMDGIPSFIINRRAYLDVK